MRKTILLLTTLALAGAGAQTAMAGGFQWALSGSILSGAVGVSVAAAVPASQPCYAPASFAHSAPRYVYCPAPGVAPPVIFAAPRVFVAPAPVVVYRAPVYVAPAPVVNVRVAHRHWDRDDFRRSYHYRRGYGRR